MIIGTFEIPGQYIAQLATNETRSHWYVTYGLQVKSFKTFDWAWSEFQACCRHSAECAGWLDNHL